MYMVFKSSLVLKTGLEWTIIDAQVLCSAQERISFYLKWFKVKFDVQGHIRVTKCALLLSLQHLFG